MIAIGKKKVAFCMHEHGLSESDLTLPEVKKGIWSLTLVGVDMVFGCSTISHKTSYSNADGNQVE